MAKELWFSVHLHAPAGSLAALLAVDQVKGLRNLVKKGGVVK